LRINAGTTAARLLVREVIPAFLARFPAMSVDLVAEGRLVDIVAEGFDAGVRLGEAVPQDMVAVRFGGEVRFLAVASPGYLATAGTPATPDDLRIHACIRHRLPSGKLYRWEFAQHGQELSLDVPGRLMLDDLNLMLDAAAQGLGLAYVPEREARPFLADDRLVAVLDDWCPAIPGCSSTTLAIDTCQPACAPSWTSCERLRRSGTATSQASATRSTRPNRSDRQVQELAA
jgi:DNA-binding transcriptional LysR family regulator